MRLNFILRFHMIRAMQKIHKTVYKNGKNWISGDAVDKICHNRRQADAIRTLFAAEYIYCTYADGDLYPSTIRLEDKGYWYLLERGEIWNDRILSFIIGALASPYLIQIISYFFK